MFEEELVPVMPIEFFMIFIVFILAFIVYIYYVRSGKDINRIEFRVTLYIWVEVLIMTEMAFIFIGYFNMSLFGTLIILPATLVIILCMGI